MNHKLAMVLMVSLFSVSAFAAEGFPGTIPHDTKAYEPVTAEKNMCLACHQKATGPVKKVKGVPTQTPLDHFETNGKIAGMRTNCMMCHMPVKP